MSTQPKYAFMQSLLDEVLDIQSNCYRDSNSVKRVNEIIKKSNELIKDSNVLGEVVMDAKILQKGSQIVNSNIISMETNLSNFNMEEYVTNIRGMLEEQMDVDDVEEDEESPENKSFGSRWRYFAPIMYPMFYKSDSPTFLIGCLSFEQPELKPRPKSERIYKRMSEAKTQLTGEAFVSSDQRRPEESICEHILRALVWHMKTNQEEPLEFIRFIINPDSYWETIQNIFYFSFLVRDGRVEMLHDRRGLPIIAYSFREPGADSPPEKINHFSISLSMKEWRACIEKFKITTPMIRPLNDMI